MNALILRPVGSVSGDSTVVASTRQVSTEVEGESVILNFDDGVYYGLDNLGTLVWSLLSEPIAVSEIRDAIVAEYEVDDSRCETDLLELLNDMQGAGLVQVSESTAS